MLMIKSSGLKGDCAPDKVNSAFRVDYLVGWFTTANGTWSTFLYDTEW